MTDVATLNTPADGASVDRLKELLKEKPPLVFQGISDRARELLERPDGEGVDVDWKESTGFDADCIAAFANSQGGGSLLVGVKEIKDKYGRPRPDLVGCPHSDGEILKILDKARSCIQPIDIEIYLENHADPTRSFIRVEIPSGPHKPYSTRGGTYKIRFNRSSVGIAPSDLLAMFVAAEGERFLLAFQQATVNLEDMVSYVHQQLEGSMLSLQSQLSVSGEDVVYEIGDEISQKIKEVQIANAGTPQVLEEINDQVWAIMKHLGIEHPYIARQRIQMEQLVEEECRKAKRLNPQSIFTRARARFKVDGMHAIRESVLRKWCNNKVAAIAGQRESKLKKK